jgi:hypothetical protein
VIGEKIAMGDGRFDPSRLTRAIEQHSQRHILFDMERLRAAAAPSSTR